MLEKTLQKIREAEAAARELAEKARTDADLKIKKFRAEKENEWRELQKSLVKIQQEIIEDYRNQAQKESEKIEKKEMDKISKIENLNSKKDSIINKIVKDILS